MPDGPLAGWLESPLGRQLLAVESQAVSRALTGVFGFVLLQLGDWGRNGLLLHGARTRRAAVVAPRPGSRIELVCEPGALGLANGSVDAVLLPHTLEFDADPRRVLREAQRVLVGEGSLVIVGFNPLGSWGIRRVLSGGRFPPGTRQLISEYRLRDWLGVLGFDIVGTRFCHYALPVNRLKPPDMPRFVAFAERYCPWLAGVYLIVARNRVIARLPRRPVVVRKRRLVGGLVEPTTRSR